MFKFIITFLLLLVSFKSEAQEQLFKYKKVADELIRTHFDTSLLSAMICKTFWLENVDRNTGYGNAGSYVYDKEKFKRKIFTSIAFNYFFYSPSLKDTLGFNLTLNSKKKPVYYQHLFENVPLCVRQNSSCKFISKDSAFKIALNDSIKYSENISINFQPAPKTNIFYWVITAQHREIPVRRARPSSGWVSVDYRYINAETGEIISRQKFFGNS